MKTEHGFWAKQPMHSTAYKEKAEMYKPDDDEVKILNSVWAHVAP